MGGFFIPVAVPIVAYACFVCGSLVVLVIPIAKTLFMGGVFSPKVHPGRTVSRSYFPIPIKNAQRDIAFFNKFSASQLSVPPRVVQLVEIIWKLFLWTSKPDARAFAKAMPSFAVDYLCILIV